MISNEELVEQIRALLLDTPSKRTKDEQKYHFKTLFELTNELVLRDPSNAYYRELKAVTLFSFADHCNLPVQMAIAKLEEAVALAPNIKFIFDKLTLMCTRAGRPAPVADAIPLFAMAIDAEIKGDLQSAFHYTVAAHQKDPEHREVNLKLGTLYAKQGKFPQANRHIDAAIRGKPALWDAHIEKATLEQKEGDTTAAVKRLSLIVRSADCPNDFKRRAYLLKIFYLNFLDSTDNGQSIYDEALAFSRLLNVTPYKFSQDQIKSFRKQSPIKVGYLSSHFNEHPIAYFIGGVLRHHNRETFEVHIFSTGAATEDAYTTKLKSCVAPQNWHVVRGSCAMVATAIRSQNITILTCLDIHTERDGEIAAHSPAPIIVNYLGYPGTSGVSTVKYRLTDALADPVDTRQPFSEQLVRMPSSFLTFDASHLETIPVSPAPHITRGHITFGCYNTLSKVQPCTWAVWSRILKQLPTARLLIKAPLFIVDEATATYRAKLASLGVPVDQVDLRPYSMDTRSHYASYSEVDITLDPFPYNGTTTSMDSLWMGVPFVSLAGATHVHSVGRSILTNAGLPELATLTVDQYVDTAVSLAKRPEEIIRIRSNLRSQLHQSPLSNPKLFTVHLEDKYIHMFNEAL
eukprot:gene16752-19918_t